MKGIERPTVEDLRKEFEKVPDGRSRDIGTKLQGRFDVTKNEEIFEKNLSRTRRSFERSTPSLEGSLAEETRTRQERLMQEAYKARRCIRCTGLQRRQGRIRWCCPSRRKTPGGW
jgi:hypothetical protein